MLARRRISTGIFTRRSMLKGIAGAPLAAVLADPRLARAAAAGLDGVKLRIPSGAEVGASLAMPARTPAPAVMLIHEWWGLNDQIKSVAAELAREGYIALAIDLFKGSVAGDSKQAMAQIRGLDPAVANETVAAWMGWLRAHAKGNGKLATLGWCFGGGWSLNASLAAPSDATVIYYGRVNKSAGELAKLKGPVLGHFGTLDKFIDKPMVSGFEREMKAAGKAHRVHWYDADHAFANPTTARYDEADAKLAWRRTLDFLNRQIGA